MESNKKLKEIEELVEQNPNDTNLGAKVRALLNKCNNWESLRDSGLDKPLKSYGSEK